MVNAQHRKRQPITARISEDKDFQFVLNFHKERWNPVKKHSKSWVVIAVSKQIPIVYSADHGRAEMTILHETAEKHFWEAWM